jgi:hypothetical protein
MCVLVQITRILLVTQMYLGGHVIYKLMIRICQVQNFYIFKSVFLDRQNKCVCK